MSTSLHPIHAECSAVPPRVLSSLDALADHARDTGRHTAAGLLLDVLRQLRGERADA